MLCALNIDKIETFHRDNLENLPLDIFTSN